MRKSFFRIVVAALIFVAIQPARAEPNASLFPKLPKLFVWVVFDQMRADYLTLNYERFDRSTPGGFRWLMDRSAYYPFAEYKTLHCITAIGHSTLATGAYPHRTGIALNTWFDRETLTPRQAVEGTKEKSSLDNLIGTTFTDELKNAYPKSHVVSVSFKDRGALFIGGHRADLSVWYARKDKKWISNLDSNPVVDELNRKLKTKPLTALDQPESYQYLDEAIELAIRDQKLGTHATPDALMISFSNFDYAGHEHGPFSTEMIDMTLAADRSLKNLLRLLQKTVPGGLENVILAVTADHGAPPKIGTLKAAAIPAGQFNQESMRTDLNQYLNQKLGKPKGPEWIAYLNDLNFYFDPRSISALSAERRHEALETAKAYLNRRPELLMAVTQDDIRDRHLPGGLFESQILNATFPTRSGDVIAIPKPYYYDDGDIVSHMTGYSYDRQVPLILYGKPFRPGLYSRAAEMIDLAPTFSFLARTIAPSQSEGRVLDEALGVKGLSK